jgi:hypothetical protein
MSDRRSVSTGALIAAGLLLAAPLGSSAQMVEPGFHGSDFGWGMKQLEEDSREWQMGPHRQQLDETMEQKRRRLESERAVAQAKRPPAAERRSE